MRIVLDTNVLVSGLLSLCTGKPAKLAGVARGGRDPSARKGFFRS